MPTSKILAQAYLLPEGKKLEFFGKKGEASKLNKDQVVHGEHELRDELDLTNEKRGTRPYLKLEVKLEMNFFQPSTKMAQNPAVTRQAEQNKNTLIAIYKDSIEKISAEYKKTNPGQELETLVITPITSTEGILLPVESTALVLAVKEIQLGNPGLRIAISADKKTHSDDIRAAYAT
jgi:phytoene dehydrogenase-like protein